MGVSMYFCKAPTMQYTATITHTISQQSAVMQQIEQFITFTNQAAVGTGF